MGRRGENIRKRKDGRWEARVIYTHDLSGKAKYRSFYGRTYLEAKKKKNEFIQNKDYEQVREIQQKILFSYEQDFSKHAPNNQVPRIRMLQ